MSLETAVIPVAGAGSRMFPAGTAIEKCMMPVYTKDSCVPLVDYMVSDCAAAGLKRVIFITTERGQNQLQEYFGPNINKTLDTQLRTVGKESKIEAEEARRRSYGLTFEYVTQPANGYGTAVPLFTAKDKLRGETEFAVMGGDDFVYHQDGSSELGRAIDNWHSSGTDYAVMGLPIPRADAGKYGILQTDEHGLLIAIDEKPPEERWPSKPVANISRYLLRDTIWEHVDAEMQRERGTGEHYITYPINDALAAGQSFFVHPVEGKYLDGGSPAGTLEASNWITAHPRTVS